MVSAPLASFVSSNGAIPLAAMIQADDGDFYGTTSSGGAQNVGAIFKMTADGALTNLYSFTGGTDGTYPYAALLQAADGSFYGTTYFGGTNDYGNIFKLTANGLVTSVYSFSNSGDGANPTAALAQGSDGSFYGSTSGGGASGDGNIFKMTAACAFTNLYSFKGGTDGYAPVGRLVQGTDGNFYGATRHNTIGPYQFYGTIFKIAPDGVFKTLYALNYTDGSYPYAGLIQSDDGNFYGTTHDGGVSGNGTVFRIAPNGSFATLLSFDGFNDGAHPDAELAQGADGSLYGTTTTGGPGSGGTVFRLSFTSSPQITTEPANQIVVAGSNATFSVAIFGAPPLIYHWQKNRTNLSDNALISGSSARILTLRNLNPADAGAYSVLVSNAIDSVTSAGASLTVISAPVFQTITRSNDVLRISWSATAGQKYQLQSQPFLSSAWSNLGGVINATSATATASDQIGTSGQRFYRVILLR